MIVLICVITTLTALPDAIATTLFEAVGRASVIIFGVPVITIFDDPKAVGIGRTASIATDLSAVSIVAATRGRDISVAQALALDPAVTATGMATIRQAEVEITFITVIAGFVTVIAASQIGSTNTVSTRRRPAIAKASVVILLVPIIAGFETRLPGTQVRAQNPITASGSDAIISAGVIIVIVAVIAVFIWADKPVTTRRQHTRAQAFIVII
jgi:hypothetical protein